MPYTTGTSLLDPHTRPSMVIPLTASSMAFKSVSSSHGYTYKTLLFQLNKASLLKVNVQLDKLIWKMIKQIDIKNLTAAAAVKTGTKMGKRFATLSFRQTKVSKEEFNESNLYNYTYMFCHPYWLSEWDKMQGKWACTGPTLIQWYNKVIHE